MYCKYCGKVIEDDSQFCSYCGSDIVEKGTISQSYFEKPDKIGKGAITSVGDYISLLDLSLANRANIQTKEISLSAALIILVIGFLCGLYYWFVDDFIFEYKNVSPFWGFVLLLIISFFIMCAINKFFVHIIWGNFNKTIEKARTEIENKIKTGEGTDEELFHWRKEYIERILFNSYDDILSYEDFLWHTKEYCWGCGRKHDETPVLFAYSKRREVTWKEGAVRHYKTYRKRAEILICPECLKKYEGKQDALNDSIGKTYVDFDKIPIIARFLKKNLRK